MAQSEDPLDGLEERLQNHAKAFEALLALTPAREYYGSHVEDGLDPSEQWNRKKQTKEQKRAAKKAKLDPANQKTALDVMKEQEQKRKRELGMDDDEDADIEQDANGLDIAAGPKRQKQALDADASEAKRRTIAEKRKESRERKKEKKAKKKAKVEAKKAAKKSAETTQEGLTRSTQRDDHVDDDEADEDDEDDEVEEDEKDTTTDLAKIDFSGLGGSDEEDEEDDAKAADASSVPSSPAVDSPAFDVSTNHSEVSSSSSVDSHPVAENSQTSAQPLLPKSQSSNITPAPQKSSATSAQLAKTVEKTSGISSPKINLPKIDQAELQERLRLRIEELRARRKADGGEGKPARSRQELLDQRRKKEEQRKAHKKELRRQAKEDEARRREEQLRGSGSPLSTTDIFSPRSPPQPSSSSSATAHNNNFSFSRLAFADGSAADAALTSLSDPKRKKGPQDPHTALLAAEKKQARLAGLDEEKRADIDEKDRWLHARQRAHGERVRDDTSLLKKALKRKEKQKGRSEHEWKEREQAVIKGREMKQKKRDANLAKRKDDKGSKGGKKKGVVKGKKKGRPGFEGRFKA